jgi:ribosomal protein S18 acetylase RimI-like enzyme
MRISVSCHPTLNHHWAKISKLENDCERPVSVHWAKELCDSWDAYSLVAEYEGRVVGWAMWRRDQNALLLLRIAVHPDFRRRGVGRQLVEEIKRKLRGRVKVIRTLVRETNEDAVRFFTSKEGYGGLGFRGIGVSKGSTEALFNEIVDDYKLEFNLLETRKGSS